MPISPASSAPSLRNALAGRWNDARLPLRSLDVEVRARPDDLEVLDVQTFAADLGSAARSGGRIEGRGRWSHGSWNVEARWPTWSRHASTRAHRR